jgi:hypothetical protein
MIILTKFIFLLYVTTNTFYDERMRDSLYMIRGLPRCLRRYYFSSGITLVRAGNLKISIRQSTRTIPLSYLVMSYIKGTDNTSYK